MQALKASFQSSQQAFSQLQKRMRMMQQSGQNLSWQLNAQATKLQSPWEKFPKGRQFPSVLLLLLQLLCLGFRQQLLQLLLYHLLVGRLHFLLVIGQNTPSLKSTISISVTITVGTTGPSFPTRPSITRLTTKSAFQVIKFTGSRFRLSSKCSAWDCRYLVMLNHRFQPIQVFPCSFSPGTSGHGRART